MAKTKKQALPDVACPHCGHHDTWPLLNYGWPMVGDQDETSRWQCLECKRQFDGPKMKRRNGLKVQR